MEHRLNGKPLSRGSKALSDEGSATVHPTGTGSLGPSQHFEDGAYGEAAPVMPGSYSAASYQEIHSGRPYEMVYSEQVVDVTNPYLASPSWSDGRSGDASSRHEDIKGEYGSFSYQADVPYFSSASVPAGLVHIASDALQDSKLLNSVDKAADHGRELLPSEPEESHYYNMFGMDMNNNIMSGEHDEQLLPQGSFFNFDYGGAQDVPYGSVHNGHVDRDELLQRARKVSNYSNGSPETAFTTADRASQNGTSRYTGGKPAPEKHSSLQSRKPNNMHIPLDNLSQPNPLLQSVRNNLLSPGSDVSGDFNYDSLSMLEPDLGLVREDQFSMGSFQNVITPTMRPPVEPQGYFDVQGSSYATRGSFGESTDSLTLRKAPFPELEVLSPALPGQDPPVHVRNHSNHFAGGAPSVSRPALHYSFSDSHYPKFVDLPHKQKQGSTVQEALFQRKKDDASSLHSKSLFVKPVPTQSHLERPTFERTDSSQSVSSVSSLGSSKKKRVQKGAVCTICDKYISRDLTRHLRIHDEVGRFQCVYPRHMCNHKTGKFNRPYDYKKHLLHVHFKFDDPNGKSSHKLTDKLPLTGNCLACGARYSASDWIDRHVLTKDLSQKCPYLKNGDSSVPIPDI